MERRFQITWARAGVGAVFLFFLSLFVGACGGESAGLKECDVGDPDSCPEGQECRLNPSTGEGVCVYLGDAGDELGDGEVETDGETLSDSGVGDDGAVGDGGGTEEDGGVSCSPEGYTRCSGNVYEICLEGEWQDVESCEDVDHCVVGFGCVDCLPGEKRCTGDVVEECSDLYRWEEGLTCAVDETCTDATCIHDCDAQVLGTSHRGCEFWAVDLDNEWEDAFGSGGTAAAAQFGLVVANPNGYEVQVEVFSNSQDFGLPVIESSVVTQTISPFSSVELELPQREVDGSMGQNGSFVPNTGSGTFVSSHAYFVASDGPVAVYQFNPIVDQFSNDSSLLLPNHVLGTEYAVVGWQTANPCGNTMFPVESIPDHGSVTIVGTVPGTQITVTLGHAITATQGDSGEAIAESAANETITLSIGPYDVVNLETLQFEGEFMDCQNATASGLDGDFTGTLVSATHPVAVFTSLERALALDTVTIPEPPGWNDDGCCTDHLEAQLPPLGALGEEYVVGRSPVRSVGGYEEPDLYRVMAIQDNTVVTTNLDPPFDQFTLDATGVADFTSDSGVVLQAQGGDVLVVQGLLPHGYTENGDGDPSLLFVPPVGQLLTSYAFAVPLTLSTNYLVITYPDSAGLILDGASLTPSVPGCTQRSIGQLGADSWLQMTCEVGPGYHEVSGTEPFGAQIYGYGSTVSYAHPAGASVTP